METAAGTVSRLVAALEVLVEREGAHIEAGDHRGFLLARRRVSPVVAKLVQLGAGAADSASRARMRRILDRRRGNQERAATRLEHLRRELSRVNASLGRLAKVVPTYGRIAKGPAQRRLSVLT
jgi:hypothetical protein